MCRILCGMDVAWECGPAQRCPAPTCHPIASHLLGVVLECSETLGGIGKARWLALR